MNISLACNKMSILELTIRDVTWFCNLLSLLQWCLMTMQKLSCKQQIYLKKYFKLERFFLLS